MVVWVENVQKEGILLSQVKIETIAPNFYEEENSFSSFGPTFPPVPS